MVVEICESVSCDGCRQPLEESPALPTEAGRPCPRCGSTTRLIRVQVSETWSWREGLAVKARYGQPGEVRPHYELKDRDEYHQDGQRWVRRRMVIDRENDRYEERVVDPETGDAIHEADEPLTHHRGHGAARRPPRASRGY